MPSSKSGPKSEDLDVAHRNASSRRSFRHFGDRIKKISDANTLLHEFEVERVNRMLTIGPPSAASGCYGNFSHSWLPDGQVSDRGDAPGLDGHRHVQSVAAPDKYLSDGDIISVGDRKLEVIWTPGHAPGHCVIYLREEKVLIVGDHLLPKITPHVGIYPSSPRQSARRFHRFAAEGSEIRRQTWCCRPMAACITTIAIARIS